MKIAIYCIGGTVLVLFAFLWLMTRIQYRIGSRHLKIVLFGFPLRRVSLLDIRSASKRDPRGLSERWHNTLHPSHRVLTIEKNTGVLRYITITPKNRYVFLTDLRNAVRRVNPGSEWASRNPQEGPIKAPAGSAPMETNSAGGLKSKAAVEQS